MKRLVFAAAILAVSFATPAQGQIEPITWGGGGSGASTASAVTNTPAGGIAATDVQAAIDELDTEKAPKASPTFTGTVTIPSPFTLGSFGVTAAGAATVLPIFGYSHTFSGPTQARTYTLPDANRTLLDTTLAAATYAPIITGLTEDQSPDEFLDLVPTYDTSGAANKKVSLFRLALLNPKRNVDARQVNGSATAYNSVGASDAMTVNGTPTNVFTAGVGQLLNYASAGTSGSLAGAYSSVARYRGQERPFGVLRVYVPAGQTALRVFAGFSSNMATTAGADDATVQHAVFRYVQGTDTNWKCITNDNSGGGTITDSGVAFAADTAVEMAIFVNAATEAKFYINGALVCTNSANLGLGSSGITFGVVAATTENVAKNVRQGKLVVTYD